MQLAQVNIARMRGPLDAPVMAEFSAFTFKTAFLPTEGVVA